ncbi:crotonase/enoyl-CoA hydratase family protein [Cupriavidus lacunae]|uniref:Enoyl-CoA hydratase n=1 Tax=Cupriavidus lacunae TaxID=2666307 RepID=A0A370NLX2_9BURK|nr:crotonase/enoyl-CoA hydratase family protein [Cupriavidus lacunae]RDK06594.1 enoyl-CoA hydratase [Cupriavidus lacunae]
MSEAVLYEQDGGVVTLTLNDPATRNALSPDIIDTLLAHVERINADLSVGCVILTGAGKAFCSGGNVKKIGERAAGLPIPAEVRLGYRHGVQRLPMALHGLEAPLIAAVNGPAIGVGCDLAAMCDIRLAGASARFAESFLRVGLVSGDGGAWFLPRVVGLSKAYEMTFTGDFVDAGQALTMGLVSQVVEDEALLDAVRALAHRIAAQPPHALRLSKRLIRDSQRVDLAASLEMAASMQALAQHTEDHREAMAALAEKRAPQYSGR